MNLYKCDKCPEKYISISSAEKCCSKEDNSQRLLKNEIQKEKFRIKSGYYERDRKTKIVIHTETKQEFKSMAHASRYLNIPYSTFVHKMNGVLTNDTKMQLK